MKSIVDSYYSSEYSTIKYDSYFHTYQTLLDKYIGSDITFVEIGVFNGGSLFMWRDFFGERARIIGIDLNPDAKYLEKQGFEIYIGSQSDPNFWSEFFKSVGKVDIILDDGGHSNLQQLITLRSCVENINDGGLLICEDVHTSYFTEFGNPSRFSFVNYSKNIVDSINSRANGLKSLNDEYHNIVFSIEFFESIIAYKINRKKSFKAKVTDNGGKKIDAKDFRYNTRIKNSLFSLKVDISNQYGNTLIKRLKIKMIDKILFLLSYFECVKNYKYWLK